MVTMDILRYDQYLKDGVSIRNLVIGHLLRRQPWDSRAPYNIDLLTVNRQLRQRRKTTGNPFLDTLWVLDGPALPGEIWGSY